MRRLLTPVLAASAALTPVLIPAAASADDSRPVSRPVVRPVSQTTQADVARDAQSTTGGQHRLAPRNRTADITRIKVVHRPRAVWVTLRTRGIAVNRELDLRVRADGARYDLSWFRLDGEEGLLTRRGSAVLECEVRRGLERRPRADDLLRLTIPRRCLGNPEYVAVGARMTAYSRDLERTFVDDARRVRRAAGTETRLGRRVAAPESASLTATTMSLAMEPLAEESLLEGLMPGDSPLS